MERIETHHLPTEIIAEIFSRFPVKTLMRLRCVSKSWYNFIHNPKFIAMYTAAANTRKMNNNCYYILHKQTGFGLLDWGKSFTDDMVEGPPLNVPPSLLSSSSTHVKVEGSCNGLLCVSLHNHDTERVRLFIWNSSLRKLRALPSCNGDEYCFFVVGFDFFPQADDYKVVRISTESNNLKDADHPPLVEVYTLSTNSWKTVRVVVPCFPFPASVSIASVNGAIHWLAINFVRFVDRYRLLAFDFEGEVFQEILLPNSDGQCRPFLGKFRESLSVIAYPTNLSFFDVWMMKEYGVVESWTKLYTVQEQIQIPLCFDNNGVFLFRTRERNTVSFDCENQHLKYLDIYAASCAVSYDESLVLLNEDDEASRHGDTTSPMTNGPNDKGKTELDREENETAQNLERPKRVRKIPGWLDGYVQ